MAERIDGKAIAAGVIEKIKTATAELNTAKGVVPGLAVVIVGDDAASHTYVAAKGKRAKECGFHSVQVTLDADTSQADLEKVVGELNADPAIHGVLVQLPLPAHLDEFPVIQMIRPEKDVDGLSIVNAGKLAVGDLKTGLISCTPAGAMILVRSIHGDDLSGLNAVVVGRSNLFGKPMGRLLLQANATVTMAHSRTADLASVCRNADILVAATGRAEMVKADWVKPGATVIDVGITRVPAPERGEGRTRLLGDVDFAACEPVAGAITPVPGGVGPMTITMLMANTLIAAYCAAGLEAPRF
ncbi:UNVERIFIED_ORG: methenyltetrahydrofolate cyclohydrolase /5,10-methylenetetrahydrofolate dehydrogenase (NADP+) [Martelella mediterranea]